MGRFLELHIGNDDLPRSATAETNGGQFTSSLVSLVSREIDRDDVFLVSKKWTRDVAVADQNLLFYTC